MTSPTEILRLQDDLAGRLSGGDLAVYLGNLIRNQESVQDPRFPVVAARLLANALPAARAYRVTEAMTPVIVERAAALDSESIITEVAAPPRPHGFVVFEQPLRVREVRGRDQLVHVMAWVQFADTYEVVTFGDVIREIDEVIAPLIGQDKTIWTKRFGRWAPVHVSVINSRSSIGPTRVLVDANTRARFSAEPGPAFQMSSDNPVRFEAAVWQLLSETLPSGPAVQTGELPDRPGRRLARRTGMDPEVTVVRLRPQAHPVLHPGTGKPLDHRVWVEGGFTRTYWTGPGRTVPVTRRIGGYWMGDPSLPVRNRTVINELAH